MYFITQCKNIEIDGNIHKYTEAFAINNLSYIIKGLWFGLLEF